MNTFNNLLKTHQDSEEIDFDVIWKEGTFVFDSNVLLDLYRLPESASADLIKVLNSKDFNPRVWIGFQVILEFLNNRHSTIGDQKGRFNEVKKLVDEAVSKFDVAINDLKNSLDKLKLNERHSVIEPDKFITDERISKSKVFLEEFINELNDLEKKHPDVHQKDKFKDVVLNIFEGKIGEAFTKDELNDIYKTADDRYQKKIPPGYLDFKKDGSYFVGELEFIRKYGDLLLWREIIKKAESDGIEHLVLVTGDVKEDWWLKKRGKNLNARLELLNEIYSSLPNLKSFYLYDTSSFLKSAKSQLNLDISEETIEQANNLIHIDNKKTNLYGKQDRLVDFIEIVKFLSNKFNDLKVYIHPSVELMPPIPIPEFVSYSVISEIFGNASQHSSDKVLQITASLKSGSHINIFFRNKVKIFPSEEDKAGTLTKENSQKDPSRGHGLRAIVDQLESLAVMTDSTFEDNYFTLTLRFPLDF
ncbi:histidine kinase [Pseudoalteromonas sp. SR41-8]|uniref:PIN-like domain-containing protein n=1 Tax=Pseudoalteromonas sp. SR41-8 TaxID=2760946 RepID=UPI001601C613|nr:PIN-like domain-containing protein [Pseudoalteromonas sp. SR41-8]MBB1308578.1 histidine kinase [Pseudoalteromonas sp. SR41-8]